MKKYLILSISLIFILSITACKSKEDPITLAARAGTYVSETGKLTTTKLTIVLFQNGNGTLQDDNSTPDSINIGNPESTDISFTFKAGTSQKDYTINFDKMTLQTPITYQNELRELKKIN